MRRFSLAAVGIVAGFLAAAPGHLPNPTSWDVRLTVSARGDYGLEAGPVRVDGRYAFVLSWQGVLQADDEDFLLVHGETKVVEWSAAEKASVPDRMIVLSSADFPDRPELKVNYVLKMADGLHVDFIVRGFDVPLTIPGEGFYLHFPASAENGENPGGLKYNLSVSSGSNAVVLETPTTVTGSVERTFRWTWKRRNWIQRRDETVLETSGHAAEVKASITPKGGNQARGWNLS